MRVRGMKDISAVFDAITTFKKNANNGNQKHENGEPINNKALLQGVFTQNKLQNLFNQTLEQNDDLFEQTHRYLVEKSTFKDLISFRASESHQGTSPRSSNTIMTFSTPFADKNDVNKENED